MARHSPSTYKVTANLKIVCGNVFHRMFACLHKKDRSLWLLIDADNYECAKAYAGPGYQIRQTWLTNEEYVSCRTNKARRWEIVSSIFAAIEYNQRMRKLATR